MYRNPIVIERALTKNGEIQLQKRGSDYEIIFNGTFLMATYNGESERSLVNAALRAVKNPQSVLIGGLGVGFSLEEALRYEQIEKITVVEIEKKIIDWNHTYLAEFSHHGLLDPRVEVVHADFIEWLPGCQELYDVICLDIDNGPDWLVMEKNHQLYSDTGVHNLLRILDMSGAISFWSASRSDVFEQQLSKWFDQIYIHPVPHPRGEPDYIYVAVDPRLSRDRGA